MTSLPLLGVVGGVVLRAPEPTLKRGTRSFFVLGARFGT